MRRAVEGRRGARRLHLPILAIALTSAVAAPAAPQNEDDQVRACVADVSRVIRQHFAPADFPEQLRAAGVEGIVSMQLIVARNGAVSRWSVAHSSGNGALDDTGRRLVERALPPSSPAPATCNVGAELTVTLPLKFFLR